MATGRQTPGAWLRFFCRINGHREGAGAVRQYLPASIYNVFDENYVASGSEEHLQYHMEQNGRITVPGAEYLAESCRQLEALGREGQVNNTVQKADQLRKVV